MSGRTYYRNEAGDIVHKAGCRRISRTALPWRHAEGLTAEQIAAKCDGYWWIYPCSFCRPDLPDSAVVGSDPTTDTRGST